MSGRAVGIAVAVALVPALGFGGHRLLAGADSAADPRTDAPIPAVTTPVPTPSASATPTPTRTTAAPAPKPNLTRVAASPPRRLTSGSVLDVGFDSSIEPRNGSFAAASTAEVARWGSRGEPASPGTDTVYLIGKTFSRGTSAFAELPRLKVGSTVSIRTDAGVLTYTVRTTSDQGSAGLARSAGIRTKVPGRLVLIGLRYNAAGNATGRALVVIADLTAARRG